MTVRAADPRFATSVLRVAAITFISALFLPACSTPTVPFDVSVRDAATSRPISGAQVIAQTLHHYHPMAYKDILTSEWKGSFVEGTTDAAGTARVEASDDRPLRVLVFVEGRGVQTWYLDPPPDDSGWVRADDARDADGGPMEARVAQPAAKK